ncbi:MAG: PilX N-terminal domain-containing pilus assembly protein [Candidatus Saccharibacteria bacterium]|nr:PilX N-terminal domain-containing pilus assembly protein [Candidatus Saccharibacteria bacterium]
MITQSKNRLNEEGIVSIVVTLIIMIILTLIVTGFAQLARREQREALDRQLSAQASYAAESGINALKAALPYITDDSRTACDDDKIKPSKGTNPFESTTLSDSSSYTCLLFNRKPKELLFQDVTGDPVIAPLTLEGSTGPVALENLNISWKAKDGSTSVNSSNRGEFPTASLWGKSIGILRLDLIPIPDSGNITTSDLDNSTKTKSFLLQPQKTGIDPKREIGTINSGEVIGVKCNVTANSGCTFIIAGLKLKKYYLRMRSIYNTSSITLNNQVPGGVASTSTFKGAQIEIDSTGKAADVLKRIKVRIEDPKSSVSTANGPNFPEYVFSSNDILCKRLSLTNIKTGDECSP